MTEVGADLHLEMVERTITPLNQGAAGCGAGGEEDEPQILAQGVYFKWGSCGFGVLPPLPDLPPPKASDYKLTTSPGD